MFAANCISPYDARDWYELEEFKAIVGAADTSSGLSRNQHIRGDG